MNDSALAWRLRNPDNTKFPFVTVVVFGEKVLWGTGNHTGMTWKMRDVETTLLSRELALNTTTAYGNLGYDMDMDPIVCTDRLTLMDLRVQMPATESEYQPAPALTAVVMRLFGTGRRI